MKYYVLFPLHPLLLSRDLFCSSPNNSSKKLSFFLEYLFSANKPSMHLAIQLQRHFSHTCISNTTNPLHLVVLSYLILTGIISIFCLNSCSFSFSFPLFVYKVHSYYIQFPFFLPSVHNFSPANINTILPLLL